MDNNYWNDTEDKLVDIACRAFDREAYHRLGAESKYIHSPAPILMTQALREVFKYINTESSNGRKVDLDSINLGSNPSSVTSKV